MPGLPFCDRVLHQSGTILQLSEDTTFVVWPSIDASALSLANRLSDQRNRMKMLVDPSRVEIGFPTRSMKAAPTQSPTSSTRHRQRHVGARYSVYLSVHTSCNDGMTARNDRVLVCLVPQKDTSYLKQANSTFCPAVPTALPIELFRIRSVSLGNRASPHCAYLCT